MGHMFGFTLSRSENTAVQDLLKECASNYSSVDDERFLSDLGTIAASLPERLRRHIIDFRETRDHEICVISGYEMTEPVPPTPRHWSDVRNANSLYDYYLIVVSSVLGDVVGYSDLQDGRLAQDIFPIREDAGKQLGTGAVHLALHTEDTALEYRADYIGFSCNRNDDAIPTEMSIPDLRSLPDGTADVLRRSVFKIMNYRPCLTDEQRKSAYVVTPLIYDHEGGIGMRYDPLYMDRTDNSAEEIDAAARLQALVEGNVFPLCMSPGQIAFIDNHRCAHGRSAFRPRYDGTDRWLKRVQVSNRLDRFTHLRLPGRWNILP